MYVLNNSGEAWIESSCLVAHDLGAFSGLRWSARLLTELGRVLAGSMLYPTVLKHLTPNRWTLDTRHSIF